MDTTISNRLLRQGEMLNWYRIERVLGRGGFGVIYLATDTNLDHQVAIKEYRHLPGSVDNTDVLPGINTEELDQHTEGGLQRFITEARNLVRFKHPNIVRVMSVFELNDTAYMVMEFEEGHDLREHLKQPENASEAALKALFVPVSLGLTQVHRLGFIHRDIKPANILVRTDGTPVLLDFGSARNTVPLSSETLTALVSAGYAPLEQYSGSSENQQGPWTDIYALGAVLYFAITGVQPVDSAQRGSAMVNGGRDPLIPAKIAGCGRYSPEFLSAIDWALAFRIADRPQSLSDWMPALLRDPSSDEQTRQVGLDRQRAGRHTQDALQQDSSNPFDGFSMLDQPAPREVQSLPAQRNARRRFRMAMWSIAFIAVAAASAGWYQHWLSGEREQAQVVAARLADEQLARERAVQEANEAAAQEAAARQAAEQEAQVSNERATARAAAVAAAELKAEEERQALALEREVQAQQAAAAEVARQAAQAEQEAAAERERLRTLETERLARLQRRRRQLDLELAEATRYLEQRNLDEAESSLDIAASIDRNDSRLKALRARWRSALIDSRIPVSDEDFDEVITQFDGLRRALESGDVDSMNALTQNSNQNALFQTLMTRFASLKIKIDGIRVRNADKSISANLRIEYMSRDNGDRATPSEAYRSRVIKSVRTEGQWSLIQW